MHGLLRIPNLDIQQIHPQDLPIPPSSVDRRSWADCAWSSTEPQNLNIQRIFNEFAQDLPSCVDERSLCGFVGC